MASFADQQNEMISKPTEAVLPRVVKDRHSNNDDMEEYST